jgi:lipopolysaccharide transport system ATP-binding protein
VYVYRKERASHEPVVELDGVSKVFRLHTESQRSFQELFTRLFRRAAATRPEFWPLRDISFRVAAGESVGIVGPNGSGKSTLLKLLVGILEPTTGSVIVRGRISSLLELGAGFHPDLTGRENVYLNGAILGLSRGEIRARMDSIIDYAEIGEFIDMPVKHYSSGMYVRLGFAIAIHTDPDLLILDEVFAVGDTAFQHKCLDSLYRYRQNGGTMLLVSHDLGSIQTQCDRVIWLDRGRIGDQGRPTDVIMSYLNQVAEDEDAKSDSLTALADGQRWGTGRVEITHVELCDATGKRCTSFISQEAMQIRLHYRTKGRIEGPVFGFAIHHQNGAHLSGPNTKLGNLFIPALDGEGVVTYAISALPLLEGTYQLTIAVVDQADAEMFDYHDRAYTFRIYPGRSGERYGMVAMNGQWSISDTPVSASQAPNRSYEAHRKNGSEKGQDEAEVKWG